MKNALEKGLRGFAPNFVFGSELQSLNLNYERLLEPQKLGAERRAGKLTPRAPA
jgi:hypothetical protein